MSSDEESRQRQMQDFQSLVLPPVPRPPNLQHHNTSDLAPSVRRPVTTTSRGQHSSEPYPKPSNKGGVRGRVTVVCAECKRLKLRCSRDRPCTSCIKRACTDRCRYRNDEQPLPSIPAGDHHRSIVPTANLSDNVYRLVSINCVQCSNSNSKCDRREPCLQCTKQQIDCHYPGLPPIDPRLLHDTLTRLSRLEHRLGEMITPECDQCLELHLKCDGRNPCSWCHKRHSDGGQEAGSNLSPQHGGAAGSGPPCTYSNYAEQAQRQGLHSPQSSLYANGSRDRSPYPPRIPSPPPPSSSHSTTSGATDVLGRVQAVENVVNNYSRTHYSHGHSLSHGSVTSVTSGTYGATYPSTSTLTPITPSHPSSLHHYVTSPGTASHQHHHSHSHSAHHPPYPQADSQQHQRTSSRHSPTQHLLTPHGQSHEQTLYQSTSSEHRQDAPRSRGPSFSSGSSSMHRSQGSNAPTGFGGNSKHIKPPTPPGSINVGPSSAGTKLPEISNIMTLLSPAPISSTSDGKSPIPFPTPISGVIGTTHERNFSLGGGASIQHLQSDVRGSSGEGSRRGSTSDQRDDLSSPSNLPPHQSSSSRPGSSEAQKPGLVEGILSRTESYQQQPARRISNVSTHGDDKYAQISHSRSASTVVSKREEEDDEMAEVDEIENDIDV